MGLPVEINPLFVSSTGGYQIGRSLRFRSSATAYLNRTPAAASNQRTWTWSAWVKRGTIGTNQILFGAGTNGSSTNLVRIGFISDSLQLYVDTGAANYSIITTAVYRDPSAWYHIVAVLDTTQATASSRMLLYVNGVQITAFSTASYTPQNNTYGVNSTLAHNIGRYVFDGTQLFDGYMAEVNFIDGSALTSSSFGAYDANGVWQPAKYTGTYGTNGFYLPFSNTTSTTTLVQDASGNGNNWTPNNISLTAGTTYDSMTDVPTNNLPTAANFAVLNPIWSTSGVLSNGNLKASLPGGTTNTGVTSSFVVSTGKWYWEVVVTGALNLDDSQIGVCSPATFSFSTNLNSTSNSGFLRPAATSTQRTSVNGTNGATLTSATYASGQTIMVAFDADAKKLWFGANGTWWSNGGVGDPASGTFASITGINGTSWMPTMGAIGGTFASQTQDVNFGQRPFSYTPPTGFVALNTYNLPAATIKNGAQYMAATLWTGNGTSQSIANSQSNGGNNALGVTFQPDFVWYKGRSTIFNHALFDVTRGALQRLSSNLTSAETATAGSLTAFNSNGFSIGNDAGANQNTDTYVGWQWKAGGTGVTNTAGTITSTVSANTTAGFSVVTYTGNGSAGATIGHGLGIAPSMVIIKSRSGVRNWQVYHTSIGNTGAVYLNTTGATVTASTNWNNTSPTSSVVSLGTDGNVNANTETYVAYCFAAVSGYSAFGSYTGNGSTDGPFVYTGFRPRWILIKNTSAVNQWNLWDTSRNPYNVSGNVLFPNNSNAEDTVYLLDILSNGFKPRIGAGYAMNDSGNNYIYAAFAENPFNYSRAR